MTITLKPNHYLKFTRDKGLPTHGYGRWELPPHKNRKGKWMPKLNNIRICARGYHSTTPEHILEWASYELYELEYDPKAEFIDVGHKVVGGRARLTRRLNWNDVVCGSYIMDCLDHANATLGIGLDLDAFRKVYLDYQREDIDYEEARLRFDKLHLAYNEGFWDLDERPGDYAFLEAVEMLGWTEDYPMDYVLSITGRCSAAIATRTKNEAAGDAEADWQVQRLLEVIYEGLEV